MDEELKYLPIYEADAKTLLRALDQYATEMCTIRESNNPNDERSYIPHYIASDEINGAGILTANIKDLFPTLKDF